MIEAQTLKLIERSQAGDIDAFGDLVRTNQGWLRGWLRSQLRDWTAADDLAQDAFVTAFSKIKHFRCDSSFETWLRAIANNHFRNYIRKRREEYVGGNEELQNLLMNDEYDTNQSGSKALTALRDCLDLIENPSKSLLEDRYINGKSVREISKQADVGYSAMTMKIHRLRKSLANCIETKRALGEG